MKFKLLIDQLKEEEVLITAHARSELTEQIEKLVMQYQGTDKLPVYTDEDWKYLPFTDIECITVIDGKTVAIDINGEQFRIRHRLYEVESLLPSYFIRINKSSLANENRLERFTAAYNGAVDAIFKCGYREYVSRRCFTDIKRRFSK